MRLSFMEKRRALRICLERQIQPFQFRSPDDTAVHWRIAQDLAAISDHARETHLYAIWCARFTLPLVSGPWAPEWVRWALRAAEQYARGRVTASYLWDKREYASRFARDKMSACGYEENPAYEDLIEWAPALAIAWACHPNTKYAVEGAVHFASQVMLAGVPTRLASELRRVRAKVEAGKDPYPWPLMLH